MPLDPAQGSPVNTTVAPLTGAGAVVVVVVGVTALGAAAAVVAVKHSEASTVPVVLSD